MGEKLDMSQLRERVKKEEGLLDKEVMIRVRPKTVLKLGGYLILFILIFSLGRFSAGGSMIGLLSGANVADVETDPIVSETIVPEEVSVEETVLVEETTIDADVPVEETAPIEEAEEVILTSYSNIAISISNIKKNWMETWGKITEFDYTLKNNDVGTVVPSYFIMMVEGYPDIEKKIPLITNKVMRGETKTFTAVVPKGFAYNEKTAGDLSSIEMIFSLYDEDDQLITREKKAFDLN